MSLGQTLSHMRDSILTRNTAEQVSPSGNVSILCSGDAQSESWPACWLLLLRVFGGFPESLHASVRVIS